MAIIRLVLSELYFSAPTAQPCKYEERKKASSLGTHGFTFSIRLAASYPHLEWNTRLRWARQTLLHTTHFFFTLYSPFTLLFCYAFHGRSMDQGKPARPACRVRKLPCYSLFHLRVGLFLQYLSCLSAQQEHRDGIFSKRAYPVAIYH